MYSDSPLRNCLRQFGTVGTKSAEVHGSDTILHVSRTCVQCSSISNSTWACDSNVRQNDRGLGIGSNRHSQSARAPRVAAGAWPQFPQGHQLLPFEGYPFLPPFATLPEHGNTDCLPLSSSLCYPPHVQFPTLHRVQAQLQVACYLWFCMLMVSTTPHFIVSVFCLHSLFTNSTSSS